MIILYAYTSILKVICHKVDGTLNDDGTYTFVTGHFSTYAVMDKAAADRDIADQFAEIKTSTLKLKAVKGKGYIRLSWSRKARSFRRIENSQLDEGIYLRGIPDCSCDCNLLHYKRIPYIIHR